MVAADRAHQGILERRPRCLFRSQLAAVDQILRHGLIAGQAAQFALAVDVTAAVANLEHVGPRPHPNRQRQGRGGSVFPLLISEGPHGRVGFECSEYGPATTLTLAIGVWPRAY